MAAKSISKLPRLIYKNVRNFSAKTLETEEPSSSSIWNFWKKEPKSKPPKECCRKRQSVRRKCDPDLSHLGGEPYRTCGSAYVVQMDVIPESEVQRSDEDKILKRMEADLSVKEQVCDPMPPFKSVEQRMIDLNERKLHPFYKKYMQMPKKEDSEDDGNQVRAFPGYQCKCGPISAAEIPANFNFNKELMEKKNIFADFKQVELPKQLVVRMVEMDKNRKPTLERKEEKKEEIK